MRVTFVNYHFDRELRSPEALLSRYETLTGLAGAVASAGAEVTVVQRFSADASVVMDGIQYRFVRDGLPWAAGLLDGVARTNLAVVETRPDVIHVHGLGFVRAAARIRALPALSPHIPLIVQDHADSPPTDSHQAAAVRRAFDFVDMVTFASVEQAIPWAERGLIATRTMVGELMEGSSRFDLQSRGAARQRTGLRGSPLVLWVGRLNANKDPITALEGFARAAPMLPDSRLAMVFHEAPMRPHVEAWLAANPNAASRVQLLGRVPHDELEWLFGASDLYLSASRREGSGYALLEALSCGITPVVTDIPSFRVLTDDGLIGALWQPGNPMACAAAILEASGAISEDDRRRVRRHFESNFSFEAIGRRALELYARLAAHSHMAARP
jgi:glycosyltransferase involved in cell wall biosynthesis